MWDLIHDRTHMRGDLPFDPFMIKQRMPYFLYSLEELRCDLTAFRESVAIEKDEDADPDARRHAKLVQYAVIFDRIFRFAITGNRVRNYDGLGGQLLFAWLHQHHVLHWTDNRLTIDWDAGRRRGAWSSARRIEELYWRSIDRPKTAHWLAAYELVSGTARRRNPASVWAQGRRRAAAGRAAEGPHRRGAGRRVPAVDVLRGPRARRCAPSSNRPPASPGPRTCRPAGSPAAASHDRRRLTERRHERRPALNVLVTGGSGPSGIAAARALRRPATRSSPSARTRHRIEAAAAEAARRRHAARLRPRRPGRRPGPARDQLGRTAGQGRRRHPPRGRLARRARASPTRPTRTGTSWNAAPSPRCGTSPGSSTTTWPPPAGRFAMVSLDGGRQSRRPASPATRRPRPPPKPGPWPWRTASAGTATAGRPGQQDPPTWWRRRPAQRRRRPRGQGAGGRRHAQQAPERKFPGFTDVEHLAAAAVGLFSQPRRGAERPAAAAGRRLHRRRRTSLD